MCSESPVTLQRVLTCHFSGYVSTLHLWKRDVEQLDLTGSELELLKTCDPLWLKKTYILLQNKQKYRSIVESIEDSMMF
jgi:hypothetical protein